MSQTLINALQNAELYEHPINQFEVIETHISWIILTGPYAYKIKKQVDYGFLDFSTLAQRSRYIDEEIRLNQRTAPAIYLNKVAIYGSAQQPGFRDNGPVIEYALKMVQFPQDQLLSQLQQAGQLTGHCIDQLSKIIAKFHQQAAVAEKSSDFGNWQTIAQPMRQNFEQIAPLLKNDQDNQQLEQLAQWSEQRLIALKPVIQQRKQRGMVREGHGDLHLSNIVLYQNQLLLFDCIEFNDYLRWFDIIRDVAFLTMDLAYRGERALARRFINGYCQHSGDYPGLTLLAFFQVYFAIVRAKVSLLSLNQPGLRSQQKRQHQASYQRYIDLAQHYSRPTKPCLVITCGVSGSGKSTVAQQLARKLNFIHLRADIERKRTFNLAPNAQTHAGLNQGIYTPTVSQKNYQRLAELSQQMLTAGYSVIVDASFLQQQQRTDFQALARQQQADWLILACDARPQIIEQWLIQRQQQPDQPSEADIEVMRHQQQNKQPLTSEELSQSVLINTESKADIQNVACLVKQTLGQSQQ